MANLANNVAASADRHPDRTAVRLDDYSATYPQLLEQTAMVAGLLGVQGIQPGDRVGLMLPNVPHFPPIYYGILRAGAVVVPMNPLLKAREVEYYLGDSGAKLLFAWPEVAGEAGKGAEVAGATMIQTDDGWASLLGAQTPTAGIVERDGSDTAVILYTSGTTGRPKGAELTHDNLARNCEVAARTLLTVTHEDVMMGCLPLFHSFGQTSVMNVCFHAGAELTLVPRFDATKVLEVIQRDRVTVFQGVPTMYFGLLHHADRDSYGLSRLRICVSGGASMPVEVLHAFESAFGAIILEGYGLSETSPIASFNKPDRERKPGSIGTAIEGTEMKLVDISEGVGEIAIRGHNIMKGYWANPEATAAAIPDGWFRSGDLAKQDEDGYFYIVDRKKDLIIRGGYNVYPREVEEVLYEHPAVAEAAVIGVPHQEWGEEVAAAVALKPGTTATEQELIDFVKERIAAYKYPRQLWIMDSLPKTATGKILRREVASSVEQG
ncbi:MAG TPA: long-chain fatty acid--CoA ligase [Candidatus Limnocylindrales bacterium]|nr:long-chain fatty acid--CoA ligase [Candidatus Limnocylindrales bacterium]